MKKYIFIISLAILLSGCDKFNDIVGRIKEKSWVYSEETDKLNNSNVFIAKKEFRNKEETAQADIEFQCDSKKVLSLRMKTYTTKQVKGEYPGAAMMFSATADYNESDGIHYIKTRNGDFKIAFPVYMDQGISNSAHIFMTGLKLSGLESIPAVVKMTYATADLKTTGYQLAVERAAIPKLFRGKDWIVEIPTENGSVVTEIDISNPNIQKVFEACSWKPEFLNNGAPAAAAQASAMTQQQAPTQPTAVATDAKKVTPEECYNTWYEKARSAAIKDEVAQGNKGPYAESELVSIGARQGAEMDCGVRN